MGLLAIIGGSGASRLRDRKDLPAAAAQTPYGPASSPIQRLALGGREVLFLPRHGSHHGIPPHRVNYRANLWALKAEGADRVVALAAVGGISPALGPRAFAVPHQLIDYTHGRDQSFHEGGESGVVHVDFTEPYCEALRARLLQACALAGVPTRDRAVYGATQGPRLETAAEIDRLERDGADIVGMTGMPEAALARELDLPYAAITVVSNHAAGRGDSRLGIQFANLEDILKESLQRVRRIIEMICIEPK